MATLILVVSVSWSSPLRAVAAPIEVNTCGQVYSGSGYLSGDLDCSGFAAAAITIQGGTLDLGGFTLTAGLIGAECVKSCKVVSNPPGGAITSDGLGTVVAVNGNTNIVLGPRVNIRVSDVFINDADVRTNLGNIKIIDSTITGIIDSSFAAVDPSGNARLLRSIVTGNAGKGVIAGKARIVDSEVTNNGSVGVTGGTSASVKRSTISGNSLGVLTTDKSIRITDSSITGNGRGIDLPVLSKAKILRSDVSGNLAEGVRGFPIRIVVRESTINDNGAEGIRQMTLGVIKLTESTVSGNALDGIAQETAETTCRLILRGSTVSGNGTDADCGVVQTCADLTSCGLPELSASTCDTSYDVNSGFPGTSWGVCSLD